MMASGKVPVTGATELAISLGNSNNCLTYTEQSLTTWTTYATPLFTVAGFFSSVTTCLDWATDEFSISGIGQII